MNSLPSSLKGRDERVRETLLDVPPVSIGSVEEGEEFKIVGQVMCDRELLIAPFSGQPCVGFEVIIETLAKDRYSLTGGIFGLGWYELHRKHELLPFSIEDHTGLAYVEDEFLEMTLVKDATFDLASNEGLRETIESFVTEHDPEAADRLMAVEDLRVHEGIVTTNEWICAVGTGRWEADRTGARRAGGYRDAAMRLVVEPNEDDDLMVSDDPNLMD